MGTVPDKHRICCKLNEIFDLPYITDLIAAKLTNVEKSVLQDADFTFYQQEYNRLRDRLEIAAQTSTLPEAPTAKAALHDLLIRFRARS